MIGIVIADDHSVVRDGFAALLETQPDFTVVGTASDGAAAVRVCGETGPDVVLMDVRMPGMDGISATRVVCAGAGGPRVLILTTFDLDEYVFDALRAGASGFLLKDVTAERLFDAVRVVAAGEALLAPSVTRRLIGEFARLRPARLPALEGLTPRETEVLRLIAAGLSNTEIASRLVVTEETIKTHVSRMLSKLGLRDRTQAVVAAYESGLITPGTPSLPRSAQLPISSPLVSPARSAPGPPRPSPRRPRPLGLGLGRLQPRRRAPLARHFRHVGGQACLQDSQTACRSGQRVFRPAVPSLLIEDRRPGTQGQITGRGDHP